MEKAHIVIGSAKQRPIRSNRDARDAHVLLGDQLMATVISREIPHAHAARAIAANNLALVRVDDDVVDGATVVVAALDGAAARLPNLDGAVLGARHHPLALAVERDARDVARVALKRQQRVGVGRLDVKELDGVVAGGGEVALVGRDAEPVHLRVWVLDRARADAREGFPESVFSALPRRGGGAFMSARVLRFAWLLSAPLFYCLGSFWCFFFPFPLKHKKVSGLASASIGGK